MHHADGTPMDAWKITPEARRLANKVVYSPERPDNTGFLHTTRDWTDDGNLKQVARTLYAFLLKDGAKAPKLALNLSERLRDDCIEHGVNYEEQLTAEVIEKVWTGRHVGYEDEDEDLRGPGWCPLATAPMPELGGASMSVKEGGTWSEAEVDHFGDVGNWVRARLNEMNAGGGCALNWNKGFGGGGGKDGQVPGAPPGGPGGTKNSIRAFWHLSGERRANQPR